MVTKVYGAALLGIDPFLVTVETDVQRGIPKFDLVGLARGAMQEGKNRILAALRSVGIPFSAKRVTVNLAPAAIRKEGAALDLPIALGLLSALRLISEQELRQTIALGELSLDGSLRAIRGSIAFANLVARTGWKRLIVPQPSAMELREIDEVEIIAPQSLGELLTYLRGEQACPHLEYSSSTPPPLPVEMDWKDVRGQTTAKRAMEIAAVGSHNIFLAGPPGVGKTLLARRLPTILPPLEPQQRRRVCEIYSVANRVADGAEHGLAPIRAPHHHASLGGMLGGGRPFRPGEFTLASEGVLFLDELPEFRRDVLESLREPLEDGLVTVSRVEGTFTLPSRFLLVGAMNLCPCGALGDGRHSCSCTPPSLERYRTKVSGPLRDRIDLRVELPRPSWTELWKQEEGERSVDVRSRVVAARHIQRERVSGAPLWNSRLTSRQVREVCALGREAEEMLARAVDQLILSARGLDKTLRVARSIADLAGDASVRPLHLAEALQYRAPSAREL